MGHRMSAICRALLLAAVVAALVAADELKDLSSADVSPAVEPKAADETTLQRTDNGASDDANLGEGSSDWGGALMTSGSFTMMASAAGGEEEELGEGEGSSDWGGALMTSGSFTMMASAAGGE